MPARVNLEARRLAGLLLLAWLLQGCSSLGPRSLPPPSGLPVSVELTRTPFFPQQQHQCGPAALATLLGFHGLPVTPQRLTPQVYLPGRKGSLGLELAATARSYGMLVYPLAGGLDPLLREIAANHPVLVLQNLSFDWLPLWHYAVVIGYDLSRQELILRSGTSRRRRTPFATFQHTWGRADHWARVILPAGQLPATARPGSYLKAAQALERTAGEQAARPAYQAALRRWPDNSRAWLMAGNNALSLNDLELAHRAYRRAAALTPRDPLIWNNLAYLYVAGGCPQQARQAVARALELQPDDANLRDSRAEINAQTAVPSGTTCRWLTPP